MQNIVTYLEEPAVLRCEGDEDRSTQALRRRALSRALVARCDVEVDLTSLVFADASLIVDLAMVARRLRKGGRSMHVRVGEPHILRLVEYVGLHRLPGVVVDVQAMRA